MNIETHSFTHSWLEMQSGRLWQGCLPLKLRKRIAKRIAKPMRMARPGGIVFHAGLGWSHQIQQFDRMTACQGSSLPLRDLWSRSPSSDMALLRGIPGQPCASIPADRWIFIPFFWHQLHQLHQPEAIVGRGYFYTHGEEDIYLHCS